MATVEPAKSAGWGEKLQAIPRPIIYLLLVLATAVPLFFPVKVPNKPYDYTIDLYAGIMTLPENSTVLLSTEWTTGTRAENAGEMEALLRMLMHRNIKFVIFSIGDGQAPPVAKKEIAFINDERKAHGERTYERWNDWVDVGFFPNAEGTANALAASIKNAFAGKKDLNPATGKNEDVFTSPVLKNVSTLKDTPMFFEVTPSSTNTIYIQRIAGKVNYVLLCTGVMGPEAVPYWSSGQIKGLAAGLKGVYDLETLMEVGVNVPDEKGHIAVASAKVEGPVPGFVKPDPSQPPKGESYYPALHVALLLMIVVIVVGNIGMFLARRSKSP